jgi:glycine oxidase
MPGVPLPSGPPRSNDRRGQPSKDDSISAFMRAQERIAVVGAGIIGCAIAFELVRRGADVVLFDGGDVGGTATQASAGILAPYTEAHAGGRLFELTVRGLAAYDEFVEDVRAVGSVPFEYRRAGTIEVAEDDDRARTLAARVTEPWATTAKLEWLDGGQLARAAPSVNPRALGGLLCPVHAHIGVRAFLAAIRAGAQRLGARIETDVRIERIRPEGDAVHVDTASGATRGFDRVVLSAGAWTAPLDPFENLRGRLVPVRGQLLRLGAGGGDVRQVLWSRSCYLVPWEDGTVLVGATSEEVGFEVRATAAGVRDLLVAACGLVPALAMATFGEVLVGLRPATMDGLPILGPSRDPRVIYAAGHFRNGILLAPLTARLIATYVLTNATDPAFSAT